jgi:hypothetical protein
MIQGPGRFEYYLIQLDDLLVKASKTENPALFLFENDARIKLFMLEGLSKLYACLHDKKRFKYAVKYFKSLEDMLGAVDYYDSFAKDFLTDPIMPSTIRLFVESKREENLTTINEILIEKKWINNDTSRIKKIKKKLKSADWKTPEKEVELIKQFYFKEIKNINEFYKEACTEFTEIELQVHELRRKLRWLSIYPQALKGCVQFVDSGTETSELSKYLTPEIVNSPYNIMPPTGYNHFFVLVEKNYFLALSYVINALGKIKDKGLRVLAIAEGVQHTQFVTPEIAMERALELNGRTSDGLNDSLKKAKEICQPFFAEDNLGKLMSGGANKK